MNPRTTRQGARPRLVCTTGSGPRRPGTTAVVLVAALAASAAAKPPSFTVLPWAPGAQSASVPVSVSHDGSVVVGTSWSPATGQRVFRWSQGTGFSFLDRPADWIQYNDVKVSRDGSTITGSVSIAGHPATQAFRWTQAAGHALLAPLDGHDISTATGVSADGSIVVGHSNPMYQASTTVRWNGAGAVERIGDPQSDLFVQHRATGVSADGSVIVGSADMFDSSQAYRWTQDAGIEGLGWLAEGNVSTAVGVADDGGMVVGWSVLEDIFTNPSPSYRGFRWTRQEGMVQLESTGDASPTGMSADGSVIVGVGETGAVMWDTSNQVRSIQELLGGDLGLDLHNLRLVSALAVSGDGLTIVGVGFDDAASTQYGWVATIPTPGAAGVIGCGMVAIARRRRTFVRGW